MAKPGPKPRPTLAVIREGRTSHKAAREGVVLPPSPLSEPDWTDLLPGASAEHKQVRETAAELWRRTAPTLARSVGLVGEQRETLVDYCVSWARIRQGERAISREGAVIPSGRADRGMVRNPWTTILNQYRPHFRSLAGELGLTPSAASRLTRPPGTDDDDDPFD